MQKNCWFSNDLVITILETHFNHASNKNATKSFNYNSLLPYMSININCLKIPVCKKFNDIDDKNTERKVLINFKELPDISLQLTAQ